MMAEPMPQPREAERAVLMAWTLVSPVSSVWKLAGSLSPVH